MYCSKCGNAVGENDRFCSKCGNELRIIGHGTASFEKNADNADEEVVFNSTSVMAKTTPQILDESKRNHLEERIHPKNEKEQFCDESSTKEEIHHRIDTSEFVWNVHEFEKKEKVPKEIIVDWQHGMVIDKSAATVETPAEAEKTSSVKEPQNVNSGGINMAIQNENDKIFNVRREEHAKPDEEHIKSLTIEDIQKDIENENKDRKRDTAKIDKFYTFNAKNEEFQKLLDKEYEKIKNGKKSDTAEMYIEFEKKANTKGPGAIGEKQQPLAESFDPEEHIKETAQERKRLLDIDKETSINSVIMDNASIIKKFDTMELENDLFGIGEEYEKDEESKLLEEDKPAILDEIFGKIKTEDPRKVIALDDDSESKQKPETITESTIELVLDKASTLAIEDKFDDEKEIAIDYEMGTCIYGTDGLQEESNPAKSLDELFEETYIPPNTVFEGENRGRFDSDDDDENYGKSKCFTAGKVILTLIIILLAIELVILGIKYIAPSSSAAKFINDKIDIIAGLFIDDEETIVPDDKVKEDEVKPEVKPEKQIIDTEPMTDKAALVNLQIGNNKNISSITASEKWKYNPTTSYKVDAVKDSMPLKNNLLFTKADGTAVYVDQTVVGTLIAFDSQWIDYVNTMDRSVFTILKKDSDAYKNCVAYKKAGKVKKTFKSLEIGEIRTDSSGYYVWAHEEIQTVENGKTSNDEFNWVYYMQTVDQQMRIVDYCKF